MSAKAADDVVAVSMRGNVVGKERLGKSGKGVIWPFRGKRRSGRY